MAIQRIPALGTSWYERRISYWARRMGMLLVVIVALAIYIAIISGVVRAAGPPGSPGFLAVLTAEAVFTLVSGVLMIRHFWRLGVSGQMAATRPGRNRGLGAGMGLLASSAGGAIGAFLIVVSALFSAGFVLAMTVLCLVPVLPTERSARLQLAETLRLRQHAHQQQGTGHPTKHHGGRH